jgi:hypothetical protein
METGRAAGEDSQPELSASSEDAVLPPSSDLASGSGVRGFSVYPYRRFLAAMRGEIPLDVYVGEVSAHVEAQLPGARNQTRST